MVLNSAYLLMLLILLPDNYVMSRTKAATYQHKSVTIKNNFKNPTWLPISLLKKHANLQNFYSTKLWSYMVIIMVTYLLIFCLLSVLALKITYLFESVSIIKNILTFLHISLLVTIVFVSCNILNIVCLDQMHEFNIYFQASQLILLAYYCVVIMASKGLISLLLGLSQLDIVPDRYHNSCPFNLFQLVYQLKT